MLYIDLQRLLAQKGISNPILYLHKNGFTRHTAHRLLYNQTYMVNFRHIERLCVLLNCSLTDLFAWQPDAKTPIPPGHPLHELKRGPLPTNINDDLQKLPPQQLEQVRHFIQNLAKTPPPEE